jgi:hypothetical protein
MNVEILDTIHDIFETGVANTEKTRYTEEQWWDIYDAFNEMFYTFLYKCK